MAREGGAYRPASLSGTYSRVPHEVIAEAHRLGMPNVWAVLLMLLSYTGEDSGGVWASCPRSMVCDVLGLTQNQVHDAVKALRRKGLIETLRRGGNGRASVYRLGVGGGPEPTPTDTAFEISGVGGGLEATPTSPHVAAESWWGSRTHPKNGVGGGPEHTPQRTSKEVLIETSSDGPRTRGSEGRAPVDYPPLPVVLPSEAAMEAVRSGVW